MEEYLKRFLTTSNLANSLIDLLSGAGIALPPMESHFDVFESQYARRFLDSYVRHSGVSPDMVMPRVPPFFREGYSPPRPVIHDTVAGENLITFARKMTKEKLSFDDLASFGKSVDLFIKAEMSSSPDASLLRGAGKYLPLELDWDDPSSAGYFASYFNQPKFTLTHHTQGQIHIAQILDAISKLRLSDVNEDLLHEMRSVKVILQEIVDDLGYYFLITML